MSRREFLKRGFTLIELIVTVTVIAILVGMALPLTRNTIKRQREQELHNALREMRLAIDKFKEASDRGQIQLTLDGGVGSSRVDLQACKLEYSIVSPK